MKKLLLTLFMATLSAISFAQANYGKYSMQHSTSEADLQQYIGQHVKLMPYNGFSLYSNNGHDEYIFKSKLGGTVGTIYKVEKIKVGKQIIFELSDPSGKKIKAKVNADRANNYKGMQTCRSFFLVDKFNADKQAMIGKGFNNSEGQQVAKVVDMKMFTIKDNYPQPYLVVQSDLDGSKVLCTEEKAKEVFLPLGSVISSPKVKLLNFRK